MVMTKGKVFNLKKHSKTLGFKQKASKHVRNTQENG